MLRCSVYKTHTRILIHKYNFGVVVFFISSSHFMDLPRKILECSKLPCWHIAYSHYVLAGRREWEISVQSKDMKIGNVRRRRRWRWWRWRKSQSVNVIAAAVHFRMHLSYWNIYRLSALWSVDTRKMFIYTQHTHTHASNIKFELHENTHVHHFERGKRLGEICTRTNRHIYTVYGCL